MNYTKQLSRKDLEQLYAMPLDELMACAVKKTIAYHGNEVLLRGLVEFSNQCRCDCRYCGIRNSNRNVSRYTLTLDEIRKTVQRGFEKGLRTFVFQSGETGAVDFRTLLEIVSLTKKITRNEAAVTMSCGILSSVHYHELRAAGADRYLMRFETSNPDLHRLLRNGISLKRRLAALDDVAAAGFQVGSGFMTGLPGQSPESVIDDVLLCGALNMDMGGVGPFLPHPDTPLGAAARQDISLSLRATAMLRLMLPHCHIPATTAAGTLDPLGREKTISAGANILMPNITPVSQKKNYLLYPDKICIDESGIECIGCLASRVMPLGRVLGFHRGDALRITAKERVV